MKLIIASLAVLIVFAAPGQNPVPGTDGPITESSIDQWTSDDGVVSNNLTHVYQAKSGFLWISSYNGMMRFDGQRFELFNKESMPFLTSEAFYRIYESPSGDLWLTTQGSGIVKYSNGKFRPLMRGASILPRSIRCIYLNEDGSMYAGSNNKGLYLVHDTIASKVDDPILNEVSVNCIVKDSSGHLWVGTNGNGLVALVDNHVQQFNVKDGLLSNVVNSLIVMPGGDLIVGTSGGLNHITRDHLKPDTYVKGLQVNDLQTDRDGALWVATATGLARIDLHAGTTEFLSRKQGLPSLEITGLNFDNEGSLWLTTSKAGLVRLKRSNVVTYTTVHGLSTNEVNIVTQDASGRIYIGSDGGDIDIMEKGTIHALPTTTNLRNVGIRDILPDPDGTLWISSYNGVLKKKGSFEKLLTQKDGLPADDVRRIYRDRRGNLWLGSRSGGLAKLSGDKVTAVFNRSNGAESNYILSIEEDSEGNIYAGTNGGGLIRVSPHGIVSTLHMSSDDGGVLIFNVHINADKTMWLVTNQGIYYFNGDEFKKISLQSSQLLGTFFDLLDDKENYIWISTNKGIAYMRRDHTQRFLAGEIPSIPVKLFDDQDGLKNRECTSATRILRSSNGDIWIPTIEGVAKINPRKVLVNDRVPPVYITHILTDSKDSLLTAYSKPVVKPGNLRYNFQFTALSLMAPKKVNFKYQLVGLDKTWVEAGSEREAQYTNLPPGEYTFRVIASNNDGVWNEKGTEVSLVVLPFFYQTIPFYFLLAIALVLVLYLIYMWRLRLLEDRNQELKKLNSELDKFVYSASHDLRAPLSSILGLVNVARQESAEKRELYLGLIEKSIHKLDQFIRDIIDFSRNARLDLAREEIHFESLIQGVMDEMKYMDEKNRILRTIKVIGHGPFYSDSRRLVIILNNLVSNAIKYHNTSQENPFIEIRVEYDTHRVLLTVIDNGTGVGPEHINNIFKMFYRATEASKGSGLGLYIVHETVQKLGGTVNVKSTLGVGSSFEVSIPSIR